MSERRGQWAIAPAGTVRHLVAWKQASEVWRSRCRFWDLTWPRDDGGVLPWNSPLLDAFPPCRRCLARAESDAEAAIALRDEILADIEAHREPQR